MLPFNIVLRPLTTIVTAYFTDSDFAYTNVQYIYKIQHFVKDQAGSSQAFDL